MGVGGKGLLEGVEKRRKEEKHTKPEALPVLESLQHHLHAFIPIGYNPVRKGYFHVAEKKTGWQHPEGDLTTASLGRLGSWGAEGLGSQPHTHHFC